MARQLINAFDSQTIRAYFDRLRTNLLTHNADILAPDGASRSCSLSGHRALNRITVFQSLYMLRENHKVISLWYVG